MSEFSDEKKDDQINEKPKKRGRKPKRLLKAEDGKSKEENRYENEKSMQEVATPMGEGRYLMEKVPQNLEELPLNTIDDYYTYNALARKLRKPVKFIPHTLFYKQKIKFIRTDNQRSTPLKLRFRSGKYMIDFQKTLKPGEEYDLPIPVIEYLNGLKEAKYKQIKYPDGRAETVLDHYKHRFSCQAIYS